MSASRFYAVLAALLFVAVSAWGGAALFGSLSAPAAEAADETPPPTGGTLRGIVLRQELLLAPGEIPAGAENGARLSAGETGHGSGLYVAGCDGWERLTPEDAAGLTPEKLDSLLAASPEAPGEAKLVIGRAFFYAAFFAGGRTPEKGALLCLRFDGRDRPLPARVLSAAADDAGRRALLLRLTEGEDFLCRARFAEAEIVSQG